MKKLILLLVATSALLACKDDKKEEDPLVINDTVEISEIETPNYPPALAAVFKAHGGWDTWNNMNNLCFEVDSKGGTETHTTDLKNRKTKIEHKDWSIGYDGSEVWLLQNKKNAYQGNARFYHNLMFYFYAMPYILGDEGIVYTNVDPTELDGKLYNGIKVGYENGIGDSPEDEYILYFDPETNQMAWLGYTVTYQSGENSEDWHFIKYDAWEEVNGLILPKKLTWYNVKDNKPTDERNDMLFDKITVSDLTLDSDVFAKPEEATVVPR
ncbi:DUF6503 family protein [Rasiella sp. SM2506]|uniref:DUF6503 family protein n=1 Tax=Rasiella sp. SM2506 TaxID=3423914 RepID=UPI003D7B2D00